MKPISKKAHTVLETLVSDLDVGGERKIDNGGPGIMAVHVLRRSETVYSIAHFYRQNGDMMADPEIDFWRGKDGKFYPATYRQDGIGLMQYLIEFENGEPKGYRAQQQRSCATFVTTWMRNIKEQQGIKPAPAPSGGTPRKVSENAKSNAKYVSCEVGSHRAKLEFPTVPQKNAKPNEVRAHFMPYKKVLTAWRGPLFAGAVFRVHYTNGNHEIVTWDNLRGLFEAHGVDLGKTKSPAKRKPKAKALFIRGGTDKAPADKPRETEKAKAKPRDKRTAEAKLAAGLVPVIKTIKHKNGVFDVTYWMRREVAEARAAA